MCRIVENFDASSKKIVDLVNKSDDDTSKLETITTYLVKKVKDARDGEDTTWSIKKNQNASKPLIKSNYFRVDVYEQAHHERNEAHKQDEQLMRK